MTWLDTRTAAPASASRWNSCPQVAAQHRVEADGRLVEDEQVGVAEQRDGQAGAGALTAAEPPDHLVGGVLEVDRLDAAVDLVPVEPRAPGRRTCRFSATVRSSYTLAACVR